MQWIQWFTHQSRMSCSYRFSHINRTLKALQSSAKTSLRIDAEGVLSLQFLSYSTSPKGGAPVSSIIDFKARTLWFCPHATSWPTQQLQCLSIDEDDWPIGQTVNNTFRFSPTECNLCWLSWSCCRPVYNPTLDLIVLFWDISHIHKLSYTDKCDKPYSSKTCDKPESERCVQSNWSKSHISYTFKSTYRQRSSTKRYRKVTMPTVLPNPARQ